MGDFNKEDSYRNLERVNFWISNCDTKASFILALAGIFLTVFFSSDLIKSSFKKILNEILRLNAIDIKLIIISFIVIAIGTTLFFIIRCIFNLLNTLTAKINPTIFSEQSITANSFLFFGTIATRGFEGYKNGLDNLSELELVNDINSQTYINSKICSAKFSSYNKAIEDVKLAVFSFIVTSIFMFIFDNIS